MTTIQPGDVFATQFEEGCLAITEPDQDGNFDAYDSEDVRVQFNVAMVLPSN